VICRDVGGAILVVENADKFHEVVPARGFVIVVDCDRRRRFFRNRKPKNLMRPHARRHGLLRLEDAFVIDDGDRGSWGFHVENCTPVRRAACAAAGVLVDADCPPCSGVRPS